MVVTFLGQVYPHSVVRSSTQREQKEDQELHEDHFQTVSSIHYSVFLEENAIAAAAGGETVTTTTTTNNAVISAATTSNVATKVT